MPNTGDMPPLGWIRVFECAARHLNFRRAADELHVTPSAVSQQIKMLEASLKLPLFERRPHVMRLTPAGERLFPVASRAVHNIYDTIRALRSPQRVVRLTAAPTFCTHWLVPRLGSFYSQHPDIEISRIHCAATDAPGYFVQVIFETVEAHNYFVGGKPLQHDHIFIHGRIRTGRAMQTKTRMIQDMADAVGRAAGIPKTGVWVYVGELPARHLIEGGHVLPEPGDEDAWSAALPAADREWMRAIGQA